MDIRDTVSRVLLGIAFGFVMGIVMYQAAGIDSGVLDKTVLNAQTTTSTGTPCTGPNEQICGTLCCDTTIDMCTGGACVPIPDSSSGNVCAPPSWNCGTLGCCVAGQLCDDLTDPAGICYDEPISSSACSGDGYYFVDCATGCSFDPCIGTATSAGCELTRNAICSSSTPSSTPSSGNSSSSGGCCNTLTNTCE